MREYPARTKACEGLARSRATRAPGERRTEITKLPQVTGVTSPSSVSGCGEVRSRLERLPPAHQIADFPHERLMPVDHRLRGSPVVVKAGCRHRAFDFAHGLLGRGDAGFELPDARAARAFSARSLPGLGVGSPPVVARRVR